MKPCTVVVCYQIWSKSGEVAFTGHQFFVLGRGLTVEALKGVGKDLLADKPEGYRYTFTSVTRLDG